MNDYENSHQGAKLVQRRIFKKNPGELWCFRVLVVKKTKINSIIGE